MNNIAIDNALVSGTGDESNDKINNNDVEGYIYFIYAPELYQRGIHHIKIGQTKNLLKRLNQLQTGNSHLLKVYKSFKSKDYKKLETKLHQKYKSKKILNEWFQITLKDVDNEMKILDPESEITFTQATYEYFKKIWKILPRISFFKAH
jgi:hypothetical protein